MRFFKIVLPVSMVVVLTVLPEQKASAQFVISAVLNETVGKVIRAIDLAVQRAQNQTIWLQNAQKVVETQLNRLKLSQIAGDRRRPKPQNTALEPGLENRRPAAFLYRIRRPLLLFHH